MMREVIKKQQRNGGNYRVKRCNNYSVYYHGNCRWIIICCHAFKFTGITGLEDWQKNQIWLFFI